MTRTQVDKICDYIRSSNEEMSELGLSMMRSVIPREAPSHFIERIGVDHIHKKIKIWQLRNYAMATGLITYKEMYG